MQHSVTKQQSTKNAPTPEEIGKRAFEIHFERDGIHGCDLDNWLQAERELQEKYNGDGTPFMIASQLRLEFWSHCRSERLN